MVDGHRRCGMPICIAVRLSGLLEEPRVIEAINVQATKSSWEGCSVLHIACKGRKLHKGDSLLVDQLLRRGADVRLKNDDGDMAIDLFQRYNFHARFRKDAIVYICLPP